MSVSGGVRAAESPGVDAVAAPRQLIVTLYGLYARAENNWLSVAALVRMMAALGVEAPAVRSSVSRLKRRDTLRSQHVDGAAGYVLSAGAVRVLQEGDARIFARRQAGVRDGWVLAVFSVPESERDRRHELRTELTRLGFGTAAPGVWVAPGNLAAQARETLARRSLDAYVELFRGDHLAFGDLAAKVAQWWDLNELASRYKRFIDRYADVRAPSAAAPIGRSADLDPTGTPTDPDAFALYVPMLTAWRRLPYLDPGLPLDLLPAGWPGEVASELFAQLNAALREPARRHAHTLIHPHPTTHPIRRSRQ